MEELRGSPARRYQALDGTVWSTKDAADRHDRRLRWRRRIALLAVLVVFALGVLGAAWFVGFGHDPEPVVLEDFEMPPVMARYHDPLPCTQDAFVKEAARLRLRAGRPPMSCV